MPQEKTRPLVRYAIYPVAGRMLGHMDVLPAEAEVPYDHGVEMDDINGEFGQTDMVPVPGKNNMVNWQRAIPKSPIANKRLMASGHACLGNNLFYRPNTMIVFGDAKQLMKALVKAVE